jgi:hypothetical protein
MKYATNILFVYLMLPFFSRSQTGADCATAIPLTLDGVCRTYSTSSSTSTTVACTNNTAASPITFFSFTTNSIAEKVLIDITSPTSEPCEVLLYTSGCGTMYSSGTMCFDDGKGLWSFAHNFSIQANTTYKLRVKTTSGGNITICAKYDTPANDDCAGAISMGSTPISDNNACHSPGPGISPASLVCASTLENTAFYQFYVASDGYCLVNISNINCDNGNSNNSNGFQVGFFKGSCSALEHLGCDSNSNVGSNSFLQFTTPVLTAGTKVLIAVDGNAGSNCSYNISGVNILGVLSSNLENFTGWKTSLSNILKWTTLNETAGYYLIERSENGHNFYPIGKVDSKIRGHSKTEYNYEDHQPGQKLFYRLKHIDITGRISESHVIRIDRNDLPKLSIIVVNPVVNNRLEMIIKRAGSTQFVYTVTSASGQNFLKGIINCSNGITRFEKEIYSLPAGKYFITLINKEEQISQSFLKMH